MSYEFDINVMYPEYLRVTRTNFQTTMPFGKYKGKYIDDIPAGYLRHILTFDNLNAPLRNYITVVVERHEKTKKVLPEK